tara:strand:- start:2972 stop:3442 length:471 start_codon:yes stop_codon:yes gene_type:complete
MPEPPVAHLLSWQEIGDRRFAMIDRPPVGESDQVTSPYGTDNARDRQDECRANLFLTIVQCISTRDIELYCGNLFLGAVTPTDPGSCDEVAEIYTVALIEFIDVLGRMSNHERMLVVEGITRPQDLTPAPSRPGLLTTTNSHFGAHNNGISWKTIE